MKKTILTIAFMLTCTFLFAQLSSKVDNGQYAIAQMIDAKAQQFKLGAIHSESPKMRATAGRGGYFLRYEKGWVYYNPKLNKAFAIWGDIMKKWGEAGYETGWLGFPITDHTPTPNRSGFFVAFDNGSIYNNPQTGTHLVGGVFREEWAKRGWENSPSLGFPKTDEVEIFTDGYTRYQQFEKGTLFYASGKPVLYRDNPLATSPGKDINEYFELKFEANSIIGFEGGISIGDGIDLYGWMDIKVFKADRAEVNDKDNKSFSVFNIDKARYMENGVGQDENDDKLSFNNANDNFTRRYQLSKADIDAGAYIRITYWLNDHDATSANDYLSLQLENGKWNYNGGNHRYREIKITDIARNANRVQKTDLLTDGSGDELKASYSLSLTKK